MISRLLQPLLSLQGWEAYALVGLLVFAEDSVMLGFVFPGETAAILGGVLASKGGVTLPGIIAVVVLCAIAGDSVGYAIGHRWGDSLLKLGPLRKRQKGIDMALEQLRRRGATAVFVGRFSAFLRAVIPGLAGMSRMHYRLFLGANAAGGLVWGVTFCLLGYFVGAARREGHRYRVGHSPRADRGGDRRPGDSTSTQGEGRDRGSRRRRDHGIRTALERAAPQTPSRFTD